MRLTLKSRPCVNCPDMVACHAAFRFTQCIKWQQYAEAWSFDTSNGRQRDCDPCQQCDFSSQCDDSNTICDCKLSYFVDFVL